MSLVVTTDDAAVRAACARALGADPVANTIFSSVLRGLQPGSGWCAVDGDGAVAARSQLSTPLAVSEGWTTVAELVAVVAELPSLALLNGPAAAVSALVAGLGRYPREVMEHRLFRCDVLNPPSDVAGSARPAGDRDRDLLVAWFRAFGDEAMSGVPAGRGAADAVDQSLAADRVWLWLDPSGAPVSFARCQAPSAGVARIGPVYTPREQRAHGYGSAVSAAATRDAIDGGYTPVLFTDLANPTSNTMYQRLGYRAVSDHLLVSFPD